MPLIIRPLWITLALGLSLFWSGCAKTPIPGPLAMNDEETERWEIALVEWRIEKNEDFMDPQRSPLASAMLADFEGLDYYYPDPSFRYRLPLEAAAAGDTLHLSLRRGEQAAYLVKGTLKFRHARQALALTVLSAVQDPDKLWLPFFDLTNGESTYGGGRYLDLELAADGTVEVDFNKAYNPLCAYDAERWNCALPPAVNTLPLRVEAGEKLLTGMNP